MGESLKSQSVTMPGVQGRLNQEIRGEGLRRQHKSDFKLPQCACNPSTGREADPGQQLQPQP